MTKKVVIAGGGTGGHLYPGIALAKALMKHDPEIKITFVGTRQGIESSVLPREGFSLQAILAGGLVGKRGFSRWISWGKLPIGIAQSLCFLINKRPNLVVGVGGYASGPVVLSAWALRIPVLIHEQNVIPGVTNKWLGKIADKIAVSFNQTLGEFPKGRAVETGNMIREEIGASRKEEQTGQQEQFCVLVFGGSQGAQSINRGIMEALDHLAQVKDSIHFIHQTGEKGLQEIRDRYKDKGFSAEVQPFFFDMAEQYRKASLVVCRAGATTLAELTACGKVAVLIPFPHAAHQHQEANARVIEGAGAADVILDHEVTGERIADSILRAMNNPEKLKEMEDNSYRLGNRDATEKVRQLCIQIMEDMHSIGK